VFAHLLLVRLGELELVQVDKIDADRVEGHQEASEFGLLLGQDRYLHAPADSPVGGGLEDRAVSSSVARKRAPKVVRDVQPELIETRAGEPRELLGIRLVGVEVDVVVGPELALEEPDIELHPIDDPERVSAGDPGARSADGARFLENVAVRADTAFVRVDDVQLVAGRGDGTVETTEAAESRDEQDHLASLGTLSARGGERAAMARGHREEVESVPFHRRAEPTRER